MTRRIVRITALLLCMLALSRPVSAQEPGEIELPSLTAEESWERAASHVTLLFASGVAYAKSRGATAEDFAHFLGEMYAPGWGEPGSADPVAMASGMARNWQLWPGGRFDITDVSEGSVTARATLPWRDAFGEEELLYGVRLEEFKQLISTFHADVADHLGLHYEDRIEGGQLLLTISEAEAPETAADELAREASEVEPPDATVADPAHYSVEFENDLVRIVRIRYGPRERSPMHSHRPAAYVFLTDQEARFTEPDGTVTTDDLRAGTVGWSGADFHAVENLGNGPLEIIAVEPKSRIPGSAPAEAETSLLSTIDGLHEVQQTSPAQEVAMPGSPTTAESQIRELSNVHARGLLEKDVDLYLTACTEDITFIPPDAAPVSGHDAARGYLEGFPDIETIHVDVEEVECNGNLAFSRGITSATLRGGSAVRFKWIAIHRRQDDGAWKMARDLWSVEG